MINTHILNFTKMTFRAKTISLWYKPHFRCLCDRRHPLSLKIVHSGAGKTGLEILFAMHYHPRTPFFFGIVLQKYICEAELKMLDAQPYPRTSFFFGNCALEEYTCEAGLEMLVAMHSPSSNSVVNCHQCGHNCPTCIPDTNC